MSTPQQRAGERESMIRVAGGVCLMVAIALSMFLDWTICTNFFGFSSEGEQYILLLMFAGWASISLASSNRSWLLLVALLPLFLFLIRVTLTAHSPAAFLAIITAVLAIALYELTNSIGGKYLSLIFLTQVISSMFLIVTPSLLFIDVFFPTLSSVLRGYVHYSPLVDLRVALSALFLAIAAVKGLLAAWQQPWPSYTEWLRSPNWSQEKPKSAAGWLLYPVIIGAELSLFFLARSLNLLRYTLILGLFFSIEAGKGTALFASEVLNGLLWRAVGRASATAAVCVLAVVVSAYAIPSIKQVLRSQAGIFSIEPLVATSASYAAVAAVYVAAMMAVGVLTNVWHGTDEVPERTAKPGMALLLCNGVAQWIFFALNLHFHFSHIFFRSVGPFMVGVVVLPLLGVLLVIKGKAMSRRNPSSSP